MYSLSYQYQNEEFYLFEELISHPLKRDFIKALLTSRGALQQNLFARARRVRRENKMEFCLMRGVIEISNHCQKNCSYCAMRACNKSQYRYRMSSDEILEVAEYIAQSGITTLFLQGGQDPKMDIVIENVIPKIKDRFNGNIILCVGEKSVDTYRKFYSLGADSYILKFETSDSSLYEHIVMSDHKKRLDCINQLSHIGYKIGVGNIIGLPNQTLDSIVEDIFLALKIKPEFVSAAPFIPNQSTPLAHIPFGDLNLTLNWMALCRILLKNCLIPSVSALEKIHINGQCMGLNAGANVMTINFTPLYYRNKYNIYSKQRFVVSFDHAMATAASANLDIILK
jgi:biotin synthase